MNPNNTLNPASPTPLPPSKNSALALLAARFSVDATKLLDTLKSTVFKGASNDELLALVVVSNEYGLNPLTKEIYAFPAKGGGIVPVVSIDGWLRMMNDHPAFDGLDYEWQHEGERLVACTAVIHRKDRSHPIRVTEYMAECRRNTEPWKMEHRMLRHKATIQGARVAFGFTGITDEDEAPLCPGLARDVTPLLPPQAETASRLFQSTAAGASAPAGNASTTSSSGGGLASSSSALPGASASAPNSSRRELSQTASSAGLAAPVLFPAPAAPPVASHAELLPPAEPLWPTLAAQVRGLMQSTGTAWDAAMEQMLANGLCTTAYATPESAPDAVLAAAVQEWQVIAQLVKGGAL